MLEISNCLLLVIDVQGKLAKLVHEHEKTILHIQGAIQCAQVLDIPIIWTEQVPEKIGSTIPEIAQHLNEIQPIEKITFSCCPNARFKEELKRLGRKQVIISGIETHVCVYQTARDLLEESYEVEILTDSVSSRTPENKEVALARLKTLGAGMMSVEMMVTELMRGADHEKFRDIIKLIK